ncbi:DUF5018 domain-containing protein [Ichthyobacterium seriolicida]|uniref:Pkd domain containing protein n=1 Tax=Ichthyobacterium seriolicida TaxID=242600 RepID=A0A1J1E3K6_9FLAO|nr:hypothetical protein [Ichthyobacterium seriolicida]BAV94628.1 pkd domain containing protein [Ichthyobacterium seriolicida]
MFKKNYFVKSIIFSSVLLSVIIFSCDKKNIIEDDLNVCIESFSLLDSENEEKKLGSDIDCDIDAENYTISLTVPHTAVLDGLKFNITPCEGTTISPASGEAVDFEEVVEEAITEDVSEGSFEETTKKPSPQRYKKVFTLTKEGKSQEYTVYITKSLASDCSISSFKLEKSKNETKIFADRVGDITQSDDTDPSTITLHVSDAATLTELNPTIIHTGTSFSSGDPVSTTSDTNIVTTTVNYTVAASDGKIKVYKVIFIKDLSSDNRISEFKFTKSTDSNTGLKLTRSSAVVESRAADVTISSNGNTNTGTISVKVSNASTITTLIPTITKHKDATISPEITAENYENNATKVYTVTAQDGQTKQYTVSVAKDLSNDKEISSFKFESSENTENNFNSQDYDSTINNPSTGEGEGTITIAKMPHTITNLTGLKPSIVISANASVNPANGTPQSFTRGTPVAYTVTAQDGTTRRYNVTIPTLDALAEITLFKIKPSDHSGNSKITSEIEWTKSDDENYTIVLDGEDNSTVSLSPEISLSTGASVSPESKKETTFTYGQPVTYTVTAENGTAKAYSVTVKSSNSKMKSFKFKPSDGTNQNAGKIVQDIVVNSITGNTVTVKVPHDAVLDALTPDIEVYNGASVTAPSGGANTAQDFSSSSVTYTVTAQDGKSTTEYTVTVTQNAAPQIESFKFMTASNNSKNLGNDISGTIDHSSGTITVKVPHDATLTDLTPTVTTSSTLADTNVYKGATGTTDANSTSVDFSSSHSTPVQYSAVGPAGGRKVYNVKVYKEPKIETFKFEQTENTGNTGFPANKTYVGSVDETGKTVTITVANTVDVAKLTPTITVSTETTAFTSISTDFSSGTPTVTVTNKDLPELTKTYTVTVTKEAAPQLTSFKIGAKPEKGIAAEVGATFTDPTDGGNTGTIKLKFPYNVANHSTDIVLTGLTPTIEPNNNGYTVSPTSGQEISGDISSESHKTFTLTKTDTGSKSVYTVEAIKGPYIKSFKFVVADSSGSGTNTGITAEANGVINHAAGTITLQVPSTVDLTTAQLTPTIDVGENTSTTIDPAVTARVFSGEVKYTVTSSNSSYSDFKKEYTVTVTKKEDSSAK